MNIVVIQGRMVNDAEIKMTNSQKKVTSFSIAVPRDKDLTDFIRCVAWEKKAEFVGRYFQKGKPITIIGSVQTRNWEDQSGKHTETYVKCNDVQFAFGVPKDSGVVSDKGEAQYNPYVRETEENDDLPF